MHEIDITGQITPIVRKDKTTLKGSPISKAITCMKSYLYGINGNFAKETNTSGYIVVWKNFIHHTQSD